jgi:predicted nucleic acid-binding protein
VNGYLVDTNIPSELTRERPDPRVAAFLQRTDRTSFFMSVMTVGEICKGIGTLPPSQRRTGLQHWLDYDVRTWFASRILPVDEAVAERWGQLAATAKQQGIGLAVIDGIIAATALHHGLTLVTRNTKDFAGLGITMLNPWEP